jgi:hypothetical protein
VAITIIAVLVGLGSLIHANVVSSSQPVVYDLAKNQVDHLYQTLLAEKQWISKNYDFESFQIEQKITPHNGDQDLLLIAYNATTGNQLLFSEKHLIAVETDE